MLFNYNTLNVTLDKKRRALSLLLHRPRHNHALNVEMLFELESLLGWLTRRLEINAVYFSSTGGSFCGGLDKAEFQAMGREKLHKYLVRFQRLMTGLQHRLSSF